jgi:hypothetical protein
MLHSDSNLNNSGGIVWRLEETWRAMAFVLCVSGIEDEEARR